MTQPALPPADSICWSELLSRDVAKAKAFYSKLFSWKLVDKQMGPMTYTLVQHGGREIAGLMQMPPNAPAPSHWLMYVAVDNCDAAVEKATSLGATVLCPPTDIPTVGRFSVLQDPTGASFAVITLG